MNGQHVVAPDPGLVARLVETRWNLFDVGYALGRNRADVLDLRELARELRDLADRLDHDAGSRR